MDKKNKKPSLLAELIKKITKKAILDNSEKEKAKAYDIRKIFEQMELDLISSMHRAFYFHQAEQFKEGFNWEQWQLTKLREFEAYRKRNKDIVGKYNKPIQKAIDRELKGNFSNGENRATKLIERIKNVFSKKQEQPEIKIDLPKDIAKSISVKAPQENAFFGTNEKKLEALMSTVKNDLNKASYSVLRKMDDVYRQTIFKSHMYLQNGAKTLNQAIDMATKDFLDKGINSIEYKNGARVNIASYAEMCLRTASHRATLLGEGKKRDEFGIHLVVVTAHANTCKLCAPWQGQVLIDDVFSHPSKEYIDEYSKKYKLLSEAIKAGFMHPNCRHTITTFFEGITQIPEIPDEKEAIETYEAEQKQRVHERAIRKWKRISEGSCDETNKEEADRKVKLHEKFIRDILKEHPELRRNSNREKIDFRSIKQLNYKKDLKQFNKFKEILGEDAPKTLEDFQNLKYNNSKWYEDTKYYVNNKGDRPLYLVKIEKELLDNNISLGRVIAPNNIKIEDYGWGKYGKIKGHALKRMLERGFGTEDAQRFINESVIAFSQFKDTRVTYYSQYGISTILKEHNFLITGIPKEDFDENVIKVLEVVKKHARSK